MNLTSFLDQQQVAYQCSQHSTAYTAQDLAAMEHVSGRRVVKPVVVQADGKYIMCALPASKRIDLDELRQELRADEMHLADEQTLASLCPDCELGAEPPIGQLFGMPTLVDESLFGEPEITFQAGTHRDAVTMRFSDYFRIAQPQVGHFGRGSALEH